ncbi:2-phosphosulfolactate phosphatase [Chroococcidiopsidales cyanobacterium LEGE 13417]|nr:2-phosphosulfolactate phosphatase [Chroococcidiopsidales cyanobacterium LEGE 13417]
MIFNQSEFDLRCEWGMNGVMQLAPISDVVVIVDVLSFSTCVEIATNRGAIIFPYRWQDDTAIAYARSVNAILASRRRTASAGYSLSPSSLERIPVGTRLVLPSPNGATLSLQTGNTLTVSGCLRNCQAIAEFAQSCGTKITVIPAGERWEDGSLRPSLEDAIGAGAILSYLHGNPSPEAKAAMATFQMFRADLASALNQCSSGKELISRGFSRDLELATAFNVSDCIPIFRDRAYIRHI